MVGILGINVRRTFLLVFAIGVAAAGSPGCCMRRSCRDTDSGEPFLVQAFVVIVSADWDRSRRGTRRLIAGEIMSITSAFNSGYSEVMLYAVMALLLVLRRRPVRHEGRV